MSIHLPSPHSSPALESSATILFSFIFYHYVMKEFQGVARQIQIIALEWFKLLSISWHAETKCKQGVSLLQLNFAIQ